MGAYGSGISYAACGGSTQFCVGRICLLEVLEPAPFPDEFRAGEGGGKSVLVRLAASLKLLIGDDCTNKDGHVLGAHDLHLGTGDDHLIGGKRSGAPELTLDSDETLR